MSQKIIFNAFKNLSSKNSRKTEFNSNYNAGLQKVRIPQNFNQISSLTETPEVNISKITKNILINSNVFRKKSKELREVLHCLNIPSFFS